MPNEEDTESLPQRTSRRRRNQPEPEPEAETEVADENTTETDISQKPDSQETDAAPQTNIAPLPTFAPGTCSSQEAQRAQRTCPPPGLVRPSPQANIPGPLPKFAPGKSPQ